MKKTKRFEVRDSDNRRKPGDPLWQILDKEIWDTETNTSFFKLIIFDNGKALCERLNKFVEEELFKKNFLDNLKDES